MKAYLSTVACLSLAVALAAGCADAEKGADAGAADAAAPAEAIMAAETVTLTGTLVDTQCYGVDNANVGNDHGTMTRCGTACANMGIPVALLENGMPGANTYILVTPANQLANHMAKEARVTGTHVFAGSVIPTRIEVKGADGAWSELSLATMM